VNSFEVAQKNNFNNRFRLASSLYYIQMEKHPADRSAAGVPDLLSLQTLARQPRRGIDLQADIAVTTISRWNCRLAISDAR